MISPFLERIRLIAFCVTISYAILGHTLCAQNVFRGVVKGTIVDDSTNAPLPLANIFIGNSTIGTIADINGNYHLKNVPYGIHQIVASIVGYEHQIITINIKDTIEKEIKFQLKLQNIQLSPVVIEGSEPTEWKHNLQKFIANFFGSTQNASQCRLLNPEVLDFTVVEKTYEFTATARKPLVIENKALGYRFDYYLKYFKLKNKNLQYIGIFKYEQLHTDSTEEIERWKINRRNTFYGSIRHFFSALFHKNSEEEGFIVYSIPRRKGISAWDRRIGVEMDLDTLLTDGESMYEKKLSFPEILQVIYGDNIFNKRMSLLELNKQSITIYANGMIAEPLGYTTSGYWSTQQAAELLPSDYEPN